jgi:hypothetical protein
MGPTPRLGGFQVIAWNAAARQTGGAETFVVLVDGARDRTYPSKGLTTSMPAMLRQ